MPYRNSISGYFVPDGIYRMTRRNEEKGVTHYAVLDVGNIFGFRLPPGMPPMVIHQTPPHIQVEPLNEADIWFVEYAVPQEDWPGAISRYNQAIEDPFYRTLNNNCEQFARFITEGEKVSHQVNGAFLFTIGAVIIWANE